MFGCGNHFSSMATRIDVAVAARLSFLLMVLQIFSICARSSSSNISLGSSLFPDPTRNQSSYWLSPSGIFAFGFYSLSNYSTPSFVVGIWHEKPSEKTLVWVANRDEPPFTARGISLLFTQTGKLVVRNYFSGEEKPISNTTRTAARASMLDSGNFVLYDFNSKIIWESFVSPMDTILGDQRRKNSQVLLQSQMASPPVNSHYLQVSDQTHTKWFVISMVLASTLLVYVALSGFWILKSCSRIQIYREFTAKVTDGVNLRKFTYRELYEATGGFREELGSGGLGTVYRGFLFSSVEIAVKKLNKVVEQGEMEFQAEMNIISRIHHRNLIRLLGFCVEGSHRLLVYEFMKNGSLADLLFIAERKPEWDERVRISIDIARGLSYLHEEFETQIIHGDIKPGNILLNDSWVPKISGFGLSKLLEPCQTRTTVTEIRGTTGYVAPEWFRNVPITCRVDVYGFGMMLLEIICCRPRLVDHDVPGNKVILSDWVYDCFASGELEKLVAPHEVDSGIEMRSLKKMVIVGMWCIQADPSLRPTMGRVVSMLEGNVDIMAPPHPTRG